MPRPGAADDATSLHGGQCKRLGLAWRELATRGQRLHIVAMSAIMLPRSRRAQTRASLASCCWFFRSSPDRRHVDYKLRLRRRTELCLHSQGRLADLLNRALSNQSDATHRLFIVANAWQPMISAITKRATMLPIIARSDAEPMRQSDELGIVGACAAIIIRPCLSFVFARSVSRFDSGTRQSESWSWLCKSNTCRGFGEWIAASSPPDPPNLMLGRWPPAQSARILCIIIARMEAEMLLRTVERLRNLTNT